jgi:hypothetical protein
MCHFALTNEKKFADSFFYGLMDPSLEKLRSGSRGPHKGREVFVSSRKREACWLYELFYYWSKKEPEQYPIYLRKLIKTIEESDSEDYIIKVDNTYLPKELTAFCLEEVYGERAATFKLNSFFEISDSYSIDNFYITYIKGNKIEINNAKKYFKNKSHKEITNLPYETLLKHIFASLNAI